MMEKSDLDSLREAVILLENPTWIATVTNVIGMPLEWAVKKLPPTANEIITSAATKALELALRGAILTLKKSSSNFSNNGWHKLAAVLTGGIGGFFGLYALAAELPISTIIMLRSIADIARNQGENLNEVSSQLACLEVFALGGPHSSVEKSGTGYYAVRVALAKAVTEAAEYIMERGLIEKSAPVLARLILRIATRFEVVVAEKVAAEAVPIIGAVGGAGINLLFIQHFQSIAQGHFIIRNLENKYGLDEVKLQYADMVKNI
jgi:hypothetical protein